MIKYGAARKGECTVLQMEYDVIIVTAMTQILCVRLTIVDWLLFGGGGKSFLKLLVALFYKKIKNLLYFNCGNKLFKGFCLLSRMVKPTDVLKFTKPTEGML